MPDMNQGHSGWDHQSQQWLIEVMYTEITDQSSQENPSVSL